MYFVYILKSKKDKSLYIGSTNNLKRRLAEHNNGESKYTKAKAPWNLVFYAGFPNHNRAISFEQYLKTGSGRAFLNKRLVNRLSTEALA